jgi:hypothetical protein
MINVLSYKKKRRYTENGHVKIEADIGINNLRPRNTEIVNHRK